MTEVKLVTSTDDIEECFRIRAEVFIEEQGVPSDIERDDHDKSALHFLARSDGQSVGTARVVLKNNGSVAKIGRVAVLISKRGLGIGKLLISSIEKTPDLKHVDSFILEAQTHALNFYTRLGYKAYGDEFMEAGIPHRQMRKRNNFSVEMI